ncbi:MAG: bifunctional diaminohydroxyphosphoribosylaminopyrimidine deaminase/5-amino-6-(5-phosphoribosylamino)uracil reductase RibD [Candidatus Gracilibacteria bacterium]|nr:bifunctional diaminohydroxyphosphoribosylaminopyrimidine deaminase/5-amino-6-(5-phosphoribosylamino)uracil reductase RibD [Candidatus Gracilibacteria bacterium]
MNDNDYMQQCLKLARKGKYFVSPNPMVGACLVKKDRLLGKSYHAQFGGAHAEAKLIKKLGQQKCRDATLYVNLEPCCHHGKTPPCTKAIIAAGIKKVVVGSLDPNPLVSGQGIKELKKAGLEVKVGVCEKECHDLNRKFFKFITTSLPYVTLKVAQTQDGFIADKDGKSKWITGIKARKAGHILRAEHDAVLVGANTVRRDNPHLTLHGAKGRQPWRIILDRSGRTAKTVHLLNDKFKDRTLILSEKDLRKVLSKLSSKGISSVLVEGGAQIYNSFLQAGLVDEILIFTAPKKFKEGLKALADTKLLQGFREVASFKIGKDRIQRLVNTG